MVFRPQAATSTKNVHHLLNIALTASTRSCGPSISSMAHSPFLLKWREDKYHQPPKAPLPELTTWAQWTRSRRSLSMSRQMSQVSYERCMPSRICWSLSHLVARGEQLCMALQLGHDWKTSFKSKSAGLALGIPRWIPPNHPSYCYFFWGTTGSWCELSFLASKWGSSHKWLPSPSAHRQPQENIKQRIPTCFRIRTCVHALPNIAAKRMFCIVLLYYIYKIVQEGSKTASLPHAESDLTPRPSATTQRCILADD